MSEFLVIRYTFMSESELRQVHTSGPRAMSARKVPSLSGPVPCDAGGAVPLDDPLANETAPFPGWCVWEGDGLSPVESSRACRPNYPSRFSVTKRVMHCSISSSLASAGMAAGMV